MGYPIVPLVDSDTKLFPPETMAALIRAVPSLTNGVVDENGHLQLTRKDGVIIDAGYVLGGKGDTGPAANVSIGTVSTLANGEPASANMTGAAGAQQLNLGLPRGTQGIQGIQGVQGDKGDKGDIGDVTDATGFTTVNGTRAIDASKPWTYRYAVNGALTFTLVAGVSAKSYTITIIISMSSAQTVSWPSAVLWPEGIKPVLSAGRHAVNLLWDGNTWEGAIVGMNYA